MSTIDLTQIEKLGEHVAGTVLGKAADLVAANEEAIAARIVAEGQTLEGFIVTFIENDLVAKANLGPFGSIIKPEVDAAIDAEKANLVAQFGSEAKVVIALAITAARAESAKLLAA
jgi:hypothetical protein